MDHWNRAVLTALFCTLLLSSSLIAAQPAYLLHGGGGPMFMYLGFDVPEIDVKVQELGIPALGDGMMLYGGGGFAQIVPRFRLGGMGFGGSLSTSGYQSPFSKEVDIGIGFGGITGEYDLLYLKRFNGYIGTMFGWGGLSISIHRSQTPANWEDIWGDYVQGTSVENASTDLNGSLLILMPWAGARYFLTSWMAIDGRAGYFWSKIDGEDWKTNDEKVFNGPDIDLGNFYLQLSLFFGG
ncbi:hypothetical protein AMJ86_03485 [bacterium SM23_57]|nr:MAG: hypothetical protein AMJ86_03485 [bacterium SM23_57]